MWYTSFGIEQTKFVVQPLDWKPNEGMMMHVISREVSEEELKKILPEKYKVTHPEYQNRNVATVLEIE